MLENEEILYATYVLLVKQGFELSKGFIPKPWGVAMIIHQSQQAAFASLYFPEEVNELTPNSYRSSVLVLPEGKQLMRILNKPIQWKILVGNVGVRIARRESFENESFLLAGDGVKAGKGNYCQLRSLDVPSVILQLEVNP